MSGRERLFGSAGRRHRVDRHEGAAARAADELHDAVDGREQGVVAAHADIGAGVIGRAALAHEDVAGQHDLAAVVLHAEAAAFAVAPVARRTACFLVCHVPYSFAALALAFAFGFAAAFGFTAAAVRSGFWPSV